MSDTTHAWQIRYEGPTEFIGPERDHQTLRFHLEPSETIPAGTQLRLVMGWFRSLRDNNPHSDDQWRHFKTEVTGEGAVEAVRQPPHHFREMGPSRVDAMPGHFAVGVAEVTAPLAAGAKVTLSVEALLTHQAPIDAELMVQYAAPGEQTFTTLDEPITLRGEPGPTVRLEARLKSAADVQGAHALHVHGVDAVWNPAEPALDPSQLQTDVIGPGEMREGRLHLTGDGPVRVRVRDPQRGYEARTNPVRREAFNGRRVYFGGIHWHSRHADGDRPLPLGYEYARDVLGLDFVGVTDHTPTAIWQQTLETNERYHEPGRFIPLTSWEWSTPTGHSNIYLRTPDTPAGPEMAQTADHPGSADWPDNAIVVPHHTNIVSKELRDDGSHYWREFNWHLPNRRVRLVEVCQTRGNFEADCIDHEWGIITGGIGASVRDALAMGYRVGFVGGTDNHTAFPTRDSEMGHDYIGMACVLADDLTRESIWQAMNARRTYATTGKPILCHWTVQGHEMGTEAELTDETVRFNATLHGTAPIKRIEVIADGQTVWSAHPDAMDVTLTDEALPAPEPGECCYYYLRLRQHDGHRAWLSPVWLTRG